jgi:hypothetical protein
MVSVGAWVVLLLAAGLGAPRVAEAAPLEWRWQNPLPQGNDLHAVRWLGDQFVAVGSLGTVLTSPDGVDWTLRRFGEVVDALYDVTRGNGWMVAVGPRVVFRSEDGREWIKTAIPNDLVTVTFVDGVFWAGGSAPWPNPNNLAPSVFRSVDGLEWERVHSAPPELRGYINHIVHTEGRLVAGGGAANLGSLVLWSSVDGEEWTDAVVMGEEPGILVHMVYGDGRFVAATAQHFLFSGRTGRHGAYWLLTSTDGIEWSRVEGTLYRRELVYAEDRFLSVSGLTPSGGSDVGLSEDGLSWETLLAPFGYEDWALSIAHGAGQFVAAGTAGNIWGSVDGREWTRRSGGVVVGQFGFYGLESHTGRLLAAGYTGGVAESTDGRSWFPHDEPFSINTKGLRYQGGQFVMVGGYEFGNADIAVSDDGREWEIVLTLEFAGYELYDMAYGGPPGAELHVVAGLKDSGGAIFTSVDGRDWTERTQTGEPEFAERMYAVAWGAGRFVAVGDGGTVITSETGLEWTGQEPLYLSGTFPADLRGVRYLNSRFLAMGERTVFESVDGLEWTRLPVTGVNQMLRDAAYGGGWYVVVGDNGTILETADLEEWTLAPRIAQATLTQVLHHNGAFYAVGHGSTVLSTAPDNGLTMPILSLQRVGDELRVEWDAPGFVLQSAEGAGREWTDRDGSVSPLMIEPLLPEEIFRLRQETP